MLAFISNFILILAAGGGAAGGEGGFYSQYEPYLNYPGFEAWKFLNLAIFLGLLIYLLKKPLTAAFKAKREAIRHDLIRAEEEKQAALAELTSAEAKLVNLETEKATVLSRAESEANAEQARIAEQTAFEVKRLREQAETEIGLLSRQSKAELRRFSAEESVRLAEEKLKAQINQEKDAGLVKAGIRAIGGLN